MADGLAVLLIAAFSPLVIFQALRFAHGTAGSLARGWTISGVSIVRWGSAARIARKALQHPRFQDLRRSTLQGLRGGRL